MKLEKRKKREDRRKEERPHPAAYVDFFSGRKKNVKALS